MMKIVYLLDDQRVLGPVDLFKINPVQAACLIKNKFEY